MTRVFDAPDVELALDARAEVGESPVWDAARRELLWVDIPAGLVHRLDPAGGPADALSVGQHVGAVALRKGGGLVLAVRDGFALLDPGAREPRLVCPVERENTRNRMNDGKCDSAGRFWAGTMAFDMKPRAGALYRLDPDLTVVRILDGLTISNGIGWSPDDETMYFVDSGAHGIDAFDFDAAEGTIRNRRRVADVPPDVGLPDGLSVDAEGCIWVAIWGGFAVHRHAPTGELEAVVRLPAAQITSCAFGGSDHGDLYVTSARKELSENDLRGQPVAGGVFRVRPEVTGAPVHRFAA